MKKVHLFCLIILLSAVLPPPSPSQAALQALQADDPGFLDAVLSFFSSDFHSSKQVLGFMKSRAAAARSILDVPGVGLAEKNRRIFIEVNRANRVLQENRRQIPEELYATFKFRIDLARRRVAASDFWLKKKKDPARALAHLRAFRDEVQDTLDTLGRVEWMSGGF